MDWIQQWQSKFNKQNGVAPLVRTGGSRHTGLAALPYRNIHLMYDKFTKYDLCILKNKEGLLLSLISTLSNFPLNISILLSFKCILIFLPLLSKYTISLIGILIQ